MGLRRLIKPGKLTNEFGIDWSNDHEGFSGELYSNSNLPNNPRNLPSNLHSPQNPHQSPQNQEIDNSFEVLLKVILQFLVGFIFWN